MTSDLQRQLEPRIEEIARRLLGAPNTSLSTQSQLRFGRHGSLAVEIDGAKRGQWFDHESKHGGGIVDLVMQRLGLDRQGALSWIAESLGIASPRSRRAPSRQIVATHDYRDESGSLLMQVVRYAPKAFRQRCPDGRGGWSWRMKGVRPVPYRLFELQTRSAGVPEADRTVFVVEGEKDVDRLASLGLVATCNAGGANKWPPELSAHFQGLDVCILPDHDEAGRSHVQKVASALHGIAQSVRIIPLPGLPVGGDVSDWLDAGGTVSELRTLCGAAPSWELEAAQASSSELTEQQLLPYCDEALTLAFSARFAQDLRYCDAFGRWFEWDDGRWREDARRRVFSHARQLCRDHALEAMSEIDDGKAAARIAALVASARAVAAVVNLARADVRHATAAEDWDQDAWTLNTPAGLVDLRSGRLQPHDRGTLCSKITAVAPVYGRCPRWLRFLDEITQGDTALQAFLGRVAGYGLTGSTREHALFFFYGTGANGKGTFLNTLTGIMGDYARIASMETFTETSGDRHPTELAMLRGARLVAAQETDEGRRWAESRIKALTGGDPITARFMRQDFFTFNPQFKLLIAGNHKPGLRNIDEAIRRRFHLLPFTVRIPPERRDPQLAETLRAEWPAILTWAIHGCLEWQAQGLCPPPSVIEATSEYFEDEDSFGGWLAECCARDPMAHETTRELYASWTTWAQRAGLSPGTEPKFRSLLKARGYEAKREAGTGRGGFSGICLRRRDYTDDLRYGG